MNIEFPATALSQFSTIVEEINAFKPGDFKGNFVKIGLFFVSNSSKKLSKTVKLLLMTERI
ncbi:hypothetical protein GCM10027442_44740 [Emticicia fontis]